MARGMGRRIPGVERRSGLEGLRYGSTRATNAERATLVLPGTFAVASRGGEVPRFSRRRRASSASKPRRARVEAASHRRQPPMAVGGVRWSADERGHDADERGVLHAPAKHLPRRACVGALRARSDERSPGERLDDRRLDAARAATQSTGVKHSPPRPTASGCPYEVLSRRDRSHRAYLTHLASSANDGFFPYISIPTR